MYDFRQSNPLHFSFGPSHSYHIRHFVSLSLYKRQFVLCFSSSLAVCHPRPLPIEKLFFPCLNLILIQIPHDLFCCKLGRPPLSTPRPFSPHLFFYAGPLDEKLPLQDLLNDLPIFLTPRFSEDLLADISPSDSPPLVGLQSRSRN